MNPAFLAMSAANPGLLPMAALDMEASTRWSRRPVRWETDDETLTRVQRAWEVRERERLELEAFEAWMAEPGNDLIYLRQMKTLDRLNAAHQAEWLAEQEARDEAMRVIQKEHAADFEHWLATTRFVWTGVAAVAGLGIEALGAPLWGAWGLFGALMLLLVWFGRAARDEYVAPSEDPWTRYRRMDTLPFIYSSPRVLGANWRFGDLDELEPAQ